MIFQVCLSLGSNYSPRDSFEDSLLSAIDTSEVDVSDGTFSEVDSTATAYPIPLEEIPPAKCIFKDLLPGRRYALRCGYFLEGMTKGESLFDAVFSQVYEYSEFWTLPSDSDNNHVHYSPDDPPVCSPISLLALGQGSLWTDAGSFRAASLSQKPSASSPSTFQNENNQDESSTANEMASFLNVDVNFVDEPIVCCLLGDVFSKLQSENDSAVVSTAYYTENIDWIYRKSKLLASNVGLLRNAASFLAWTDSSANSLRLLRHEEEAFKQYRKDLKRFNRKASTNTSSGKPKKNTNSANPPALHRPAIENPLKPLSMVMITE